MVTGTHRCAAALPDAVNHCRGIVLGATADFSPAAATVFGLQTKLAMRQVDANRSGGCFGGVIALQAGIKAVFIVTVPLGGEVDVAVICDGVIEFYCVGVALVAGAQVTIEVGFPAFGDGADTSVERVVAKLFVAIQAAQ